jgi:RNAse (barnase) inhibitor barstar
VPTLVLDGVRWNTVEDFYDAFLEAVGAPSWHGHNLDALNDSIGGDDVNTVRLPYDIVVHGTSRMSEPALAMVKRFRELIEDLAPRERKWTSSCRNDPRFARA